MTEDMDGDKISTTSLEHRKHLSENKKRFYHNRPDRRRTLGLYTVRNFQKKRGENRLSLSTKLGVTMKVHWDGDPDIWLNDEELHITPDLDPDDLRVRLEAWAAVNGYEHRGLEWRFEKR